MLFMAYQAIRHSKERINELENKSIEIIQTETKSTIGVGENKTNNNKNKNPEYLRALVTVSNGLIQL